MAWKHGGADFQSRFDKSTAQAQEMKEGGYGFYDSWHTMAALEALVIPQQLQPGNIRIWSP